jgi:tripartite-type tricarboxylate transporter receptor subunit TctC
MATTKSVWFAFISVFAFLSTELADAAQKDAGPIRFIVPFAPGGQVDLMARLVSAHLSKELSRTIVVDNRAGASGLIAMKIALEAPADANTLVFGSASTMAFLPHATAKAPYDPIRDFTGISLVATSPYVLVVQSSSTVRSVADLIKVAKDGPGRLTYGTAGHMAGTHITTELFNAMAGVSTTHVPYKGSGPATVALLGDQITFLFNNLLPSLPHIRSGKLRALGVTTSHRNRALPNVPTIAEAGVSGYESGAWNGVVSPGKPVKAKVDMLYKGIVAILAKPELIATMNAQGSEVIGSTPQEFATFIKNENAKWREVVQKIASN